MFTLPLATQASPALMQPLQAMSVFILDDDTTQTALLESILLHAGLHNITSFHNAPTALMAIKQFTPDLLLLDLTMPQVDGFALLETLRHSLPETEPLPVLVLTADERDSVKKRALASGAHDFLKKPFDTTEVVLRVKNLLRTQFLYKQLQARTLELEQSVNQQSKQLENSYLEMLTRLANIAEYRDEKTVDHSWRVAQLSAQLAAELRQDEGFIRLLLRAARVHDVGKVAIPDHILRKPSKLNTEEFEVIKQHPRIGAQFLSGGQSPLFKLAETIALTHHERWDGKGYPQGLKNEAIPLVGRIVALADTFEALIQDRHHRRALSIPEAVREIESQRGQQFDPTVVNAFLALHERGELNSLDVIESTFTQW
ncbi:MAG: response regulator [Trueperaceae bacterium]